MGDLRYFKELGKAFIGHLRLARAEILRVSGETVDNAELIEGIDNCIAQEKELE